MNSPVSTYFGLDGGGLDDEIIPLMSTYGFGDESGAVMTNSTGLLLVTRTFMAVSPSVVISFTLDRGESALIPWASCWSKSLVTCVPLRKFSVEFL